jgi:hypothetical protein
MAWKVFRWTFVQIILVVNLTVAQTDLWETMKKGQLMAADEATLKMAMNMALANDYEAMAELTLRGRLALSQGGEQVAYLKVHQFTIEVRKKGSAKVWWINIDALKEDNPKLAEEEPELEKYDRRSDSVEHRSFPWSVIRLSHGGFYSLSWVAHVFPDRSPCRAPVRRCPFSPKTPREQLL